MEIILGFKVTTDQVKTKNFCFKRFWRFVNSALNFCDQRCKLEVNQKSMELNGKMADDSLIEFVPANKKLEAGALYNDELWENKLFK